MKSTTTKPAATTAAAKTDIRTRAEIAAHVNIAKRQDAAAEVERKLLDLQGDVERALAQVRAHGEHGAKNINTFALTAANLDAAVVKLRELVEAGEAMRWTLDGE
jgi:hypothetical protein